MLDIRSIKKAFDLNKALKQAREGGLLPSHLAGIPVQLSYSPTSNRLFFEHNLLAKKSQATARILNASFDSVEDALAAAKTLAAVELQGA